MGAAKKPVFVVVDDDRKVCLTVRDMLKASLDCEVYCAFGGKTGYMLIWLFRPDAVVLDMKMPGMDGLAVLEKMKKNIRLCNVPVVMFTGYDEPISREKAVYWYADAYVTKPCNLSELLAAIDRVVAGRQTPGASSTEAPNTSCLNG